jgi:hypothetical protein
MTEIERYQPKEVDIAPPIDSWARVFAPLVQLAEHVAPTEFVPRALRGNAPAAAAAMLYGRELGMGPMLSLQNVHVIEGTPTLKPQQMRAMVLRAGHDIDFREHTRARCVLAGRRKGQTGYTIVEWTMEDAREMNLVHKSNWKRMPRQMLVARATGELCRMIFADVIGGAYTPEEIDDGAAAAEPGTTAPADPMPPRRTVQRATPITRSPTSATDRATPAAQPPGDDQPPLPDEITEQGNTADTGPVDGEQVDDDTTNAPLPSDVEPAESSGPVTDAQLRRLHTVLSKHGVNDRDERLRIARTVVGRDLASSTELTKTEAGALIDLLHTIEKQAGDEHFTDALDALLDASDENPQEGEQS